MILTQPELTKYHDKRQYEKNGLNSDFLLNRCGKKPNPSSIVKMAGQLFSRIFGLIDLKD